MGNLTSRRSTRLIAFFFLLVLSSSASADITNAGMMDTVLARYAAVTGLWAATITAHATRLFWTLSLISMVWTFGLMALRKADIGEFFAEFIKFTIFTGFFWWLLVQGPYIATTIIASMRDIGASAATAAGATGTSGAITPSGIVDIGFDIFAKVLTKTTIWSPISSAVGITLSVLILLILALISVNMLLLLISSWTLAYAGIFFLGFGGSRWTSDMAIGYFRTILGVAAQIFAMVLLVGIGKSIIDNFYTRISSGINLNELAVILVVAVCLLALVTKVPGLIGGLASGGGTGALGEGFGASAIVAAATMGAAAAASVGAAAVGAGASVGGGAQALMAAFSKASAAEATRGGSTEMMPTSGGSSSSGATKAPGGGELAAAMGDDIGSSSVSSNSPAMSAQSSSAAMPNMVSSADGAVSGEAGSGTVSSQVDAKAPADGGPDKAGPSVHATATSSSNSVGTDQPSNKDSGPSNVKSSNTAAKIAAKVGRVAAGTGANLALGTWDVAKSKGTNLIADAMERMSTTTGGQIAKAIDSRAEAEKTSFERKDGENNCLSGGEHFADSDAEVAAFRDAKG